MFPVPKEGCCYPSHRALSSLPVSMSACPLFMHNVFCCYSMPCEDCKEHDQERVDHVVLPPLGGPLKGVAVCTCVQKSHARVVCDHLCLVSSLVMLLNNKKSSCQTKPDWHPRQPFNYNLDKSNRMVSTNLSHPVESMLGPPVNALIATAV